VIGETVEKFPGNIRLRVNISSQGTENLINKDTIAEVLQIGKLRKAWICGTSGFSGFIQNILKEVDVPRKKIVNL